MGSAAVLMTGVDNANNYRTVRVGDDGHFGSATGERLVGSGTLNGSFSHVYAHTSSVLTSVVSNNLRGTLTSIPIQAGSTWRCCNLSQIVLGTGDITAYDA